MGVLEVGILVLVLVECLFRSMDLLEGRVGRPFWLCVLLRRRG